MAAGTSTYVHDQSSGDTAWTVVHNLGGFPVVQILDSNDEVVSPSGIVYVDENTITVNFSSSKTGKVLCAYHEDLQFEFTATADESIVHGLDFSSGTGQVIATVWVDLGGGNYEVWSPTLEEFDDLDYRLTWSSVRSGFVAMVEGVKTVVNPYSNPETVTHSLGQFPLVGVLDADDLTKVITSIVHGSVNAFNIESDNLSALSYVLVDMG